MLNNIKAYAADKVALWRTLRKRRDSVLTAAEDFINYWETDAGYNENLENSQELKTLEKEVKKLRAIEHEMGIHK